MISMRPLIEEPPQGPRRARNERYNAVSGTWEPIEPKASRPEPVEPTLYTGLYL